MKNYVKNILLYLVALLGVIAFIAMFSNSLVIFDSTKGTWSIYNVRPYVGETFNGETIYNGTLLPVFGYTIPLLLGILIIVESFKSSWLKKLRAMNTIFAILFLVSSVLVLLTKELFLKANGYQETNLIKNGSGPIFAAICSCLAAIILLIVTWFPSKTEIKFIEK